MEDTIRYGFDAALTLLVAVVGWVLNRVGGKIDKLETKIEFLEKEVNDVKVDLPSNYITKQDFSNFETRLWTTLDRIEDKIK